MNGWQWTGTIVLCLVLFLMFVLPLSRMLWAWVYILEERSEESQEKSLARSKQQDA